MKTNLVKSAWIRRLIGILAAIVVLSVSGSLAAAQKSKKGSSLPPLTTTKPHPCRREVMRIKSTTASEKCWPDFSWVTWK